MTRTGVSCPLSPLLWIRWLRRGNRMISRQTVEDGSLTDCLTWLDQIMWKPNTGSAHPRHSSRHWLRPSGVLPNKQAAEKNTACQIASCDTSMPRRSYLGCSYYLRKGRGVFVGICLSSCEQMSKFSWTVIYDTRTKWLLLIRFREWFGFMSRKSLVSHEYSLKLHLDIGLVDWSLIHCSRGLACSCGSKPLHRINKKIGKSGRLLLVSH